MNVVVHFGFYALFPWYAGPSLLPNVFPGECCANYKYLEAVNDTLLRGLNITYSWASQFCRAHDENKATVAHYYHMA
jgi:hypothetical protein